MKINETTTKKIMYENKVIFDISNEVHKINGFPHFEDKMSD